MQKIILDTNVIISALIQRNYPNFILYDVVIDKRAEVCISEALFKEYLEVLNRPKFTKYPDFIAKAEFILAQIEVQATKFYPSQDIRIIEDDADNRLLELAKESEAHFIITGNTNDFTMREFLKTKIISPKEYWENFKPF